MKNDNRVKKSILVVEDQEASRSQLKALFEDVYDVVGPICESSDVFGKDRKLKSTRRGDFIVLRSAGAYGEVMASEYNLRKLPKAYFSDNI